MKDKKEMFVLPLIDCKMGPEVSSAIMKKMSACMTIYNRVVSYVNKAIRENEELLKKYKDGELKKHELINALTIDYDYNGKDKYTGLSEYALVNIVNRMIKDDMGGGKKFNEVINTGNVRKISSELTMACEKVISEYDGTKIPSLKYKKECNVVTFVKSNGVLLGISLSKEDSTILVRGCGEVKYHINDKHYYEMFAMGCEIAELSFVRKAIRGKDKIYVQFTLSGTPYMKGLELGKGTVGIDIGPKTFYVLVRKDDGTFEKYEYGLDTLEHVDREVARIQRKIDRSRRSTTPENYNEDRTAKKRGERVKYRESRRDIENLKKLKELKRKMTARKEIEENLVVRDILSLGNDFRIEYSPGMMKSWATRKKESRVNSKGRNSSKKRYGKSILNAAPYRFLSKLERKAELLGGTVTEVPTKWGCTGFDHTDGSHTKHGVSVRKVTLSNGNTHHRDFHSCFNIMHAVVGKGVKEKTFDVDQMNADYAAYCMCDLEI